MKRSKMVEQLCEPITVEGLGNLHLLPAEADAILGLLEQLGMKPPTLPEDHCQAILQIYYGNYTFNQWEEDFDKDTKAVDALQRRLSKKSR